MTGLATAGCNRASNAGCDAPGAASPAFHRCTNRFRDECAIRVGTLRRRVAPNRHSAPVIRVRRTYSGMFRNIGVDRRTHFITDERTCVTPRNIPDCRACLRAE
ncbi:hypothetical protein [Burkholderia ubonensis]|uniref:hypothetical protein n=1 Tax=Burkholderia ubonensis TaxID=101571 RepID=UPI0012FACD4B|nr:hypothetical protein [Burkholderia ubonensis]